MSFPAIAANLMKGTIVHLFGSIVTEKMLSRVLARLCISLLKRIAESTKTQVDDEAIKPIVEALQKEV